MASLNHHYQGGQRVLPEPMQANSTHANRTLITQCQDLEMLKGYVGPRYQTYQSFAYYCNVVVAPALTVLCIAGYVYAFIRARKRNANLTQSRFMRHLMALCVWDCLLTLIASLAQTPSYIAYNSMKHHGYYMAIHMFIVHPLGQMAMTCALWQLVVLSIERCLVIWMPFKMRYVCQVLSVELIIGCVLGLAVLLHLPYHLIEFTISQCRDVITGTITIQTTRRLVFERSAIARWVFVSAPRLLFTSPTPFVIILVTTVLTLILCASRWHVGQYRMSIRLSIILAITNIKCLLCSSVFVITTVMEQVVTKEYNDDSFYDYFLATLYTTELSNMFIMLHSATNWLLLYNYKSYDDKKSRRPTTTTMKREKAAALEQMQLNSTEKETLVLVWQGKCTLQFTQNILLAICDQNHILAKRIYGTTDVGSLQRNNRLTKHAINIKESLDDLLLQFINNRWQAELRLRELGSQHFTHRVNLSRHDWTTLKAQMDAVFHDMIFLKLWYPGVDMEKLKRFWKVFTGAVVHNFKTGYICEQVKSQPGLRACCSDGVKLLGRPASPHRGSHINMSSKPRTRSVVSGQHDWSASTTPARRASPMSLRRQSSVIPETTASNDHGLQPKMTRLALNGLTAGRC